MKVYFPISFTASLFLSMVIVLLSCKQTIKLQVPDKFSEQATVMHVNGSKGRGFNKKVSFGDYLCNDLKRGWTFYHSGSDFSLFSAERILLRHFNIDKQNYATKEKNKYQYTLYENTFFAKIFCIENSITNSARIRVAGIGQMNTTKRQRYNFGAVIISDTANGSSPWFMEMVYNKQMNGGGVISFINTGLPVENGYLTNGEDTILIKPVFVSKTLNNKNKEGKLPFKIIGGYEFRIGEGVAGIVDVINHDIWLYNEITGKLKIIIASGASAILLRSGRTG